MKLRSDMNTVASGVIAVVGGMIMDLVFEAERMPQLDESLDASSLAYKPGGKGSNTCVAIYRAQHNKPIKNLAKSVDKQEPVEDSSASDTSVLPSVSNQEESFKVGAYLNTNVEDNAFDRELKKNLQHSHVDISGVRTFSSEITDTCAVFVEEFTGESRDIGYPRANTLWILRYEDSVRCLMGEQIPHLIVCHLETKREIIERVLETAAKHGVDTLLNPSPVVYLLTTTYKHVTHLIVNEREAAELSSMDEKMLEGLDG